MDTSSSPRRRRGRYPLSLVVPAAVLATFLSGTPAAAQAVCSVTEVATGLWLPLGITQSGRGALLVAEAGTAVPNTGRISIVDGTGARRTLLQGLPSGINDVNEPSGPSGIAIRGRTAFVAIGVGDVGLAGPAAGTAVPNPNPSSPIFSSILAVRFSADVERATTGFVLSVADHHVLAAGHPVQLTDSAGRTLTVERVADFQDFTANPLPFFAGNVRLSNPFGIAIVANRAYVTDGGQNIVWDVDISTGHYSPLASFPAIPNPVAPFGAPFLDAVPTGITYSGQRLLVALFRGFPFPPGTSTVEAIDPSTGSHVPLIAGLKTAIGVLPVKQAGDTRYLVLQHVSGAPGPPAAGGPGLLIGVVPGEAPQTLADCLARPTSMTLDETTGTLYVTELMTGRILAIDVGR